MIAVAIVFLASDSASTLFHNHFKFLEDIIPILWRYHALWMQRRGVFEYDKIFSIYTLYISIQLIVLIVICWALFNTIDVSRPNRMKAWQWSCFAFLMVGTLFPNVDLLFGPQNISDPGYFDNRLAQGSYLSGIFRFCLMFPVGNICFVFFMIVAFGRPDHFLDKRNLPPIQQLRR
ncbi:MAG: hypothetical protein WCE79_01840 [Xanthobacteraceae bacterium]